VTYPSPDATYAPIPYPAAGGYSEPTLQQHKLQVGGSLKRIDNL